MRVRRLRKYRFPRTGKLVTFETKQYYVTDEGQVYNGDRHRYIKQHEIRGYFSVDLCDDSGKWHKNIYAHDLVASVFQRLLERGEEVHHCNHDRKNNRLENLEIIDGSEHARQHSIENWENGTMDGLSEKMKKAWEDGTYDVVAAQASERIKKAWSDGKIKTRNVGNDYRPARQVAQLSLDGRLVRVWPSANEAGRSGYNCSAVARCCRGELKTHKGFKWMWLEDYQRAQQDNPVTAPVQLELNFTDD